MENTFDAWMEEVDTTLEGMIGLSSSDLPDCPYWDWWDDGLSPKTAAIEALEAADY